MLLGDLKIAMVTYFRRDSLGQTYMQWIKLFVQTVFDIEFGAKPLAESLRINCILGASFVASWI